MRLCLRLMKRTLALYTLHSLDIHLKVTLLSTGVNVNYFQIGFTKPELFTFSVTTEEGFLFRVAKFKQNPVLLSEGSFNYGLLLI